MTKLIIPLLSFLLGNAKGFFKEPSVAITQQLVLHTRALILLAVTTLGSLALSCVGISLLIANIAGILDKGDGFEFSGGTWVYLAMTLVFGGTLIWSLRKSTWLQSVGLQEPPASQAKKGSPIENALALLVMDFVDERQRKRQEKSEQSA